MTTKSKKAAVAVVKKLNIDEILNGINTTELKNKTKRFKDGITSARFQNRIMQMQLTAEKKENTIAKRVSNLKAMFEKAKRLRKELAQNGQKSQAVYNDLYDGYKTIADKKVIVDMVAEKELQKRRDLEKCVNIQQSKTVEFYYNSRFLEPLKMAREVEDFLKEEGFEIKSSALKEAEVIASRLLESNEEPNVTQSNAEAIPESEEEQIAAVKNAKK